MLVAIRRDPLTSDGWIRDAGVTVDDHGFITTDGYGTYAGRRHMVVGDITEGHALAHRAFEQGIIAAESIAGLDPKPLDEDTIPQIVFSNPEAASVGLTATDAKQRNDLSDIKETVYPMMSNARMMMSGSGGSLSLVSGIRAQQPGVRVVLGVHMVAPVASDIIAEAEQLVGNHPCFPTPRVSFIPIPPSARRWARRCSKPTTYCCTPIKTPRTSDAAAHGRQKGTSAGKLVAQCVHPRPSEEVDGRQGREDQADEAQEAEHDQTDHNDLQSTRTRKTRCFRR